MKTDKRLLEEFIAFLDDHRDPIGLTGYLALITLACEARDSGKSYDKRVFAWALEQAATIYFDEDWRESEHDRKAAGRNVAGLREKIYQDVDFLEHVVLRLRERLDECNSDSSKYKKYATWITDTWGASARCILGDQWRGYMKRGGRPRKTTPWKVLRILGGASPKELGIIETGNIYTHTIPRLLVDAAFTAYTILHRKEVLLALLDDLLTENDQDKLTLAYIRVNRLNRDTDPASCWFYGADAIEESIAHIEDKLESLLYPPFHYKNTPEIS